MDDDDNDNHIDAATTTATTTSVALDDVMKCWEDCIHSNNKPTPKEVLQSVRSALIQHRRQQQHDHQHDDQQQNGKK